jgi:predicted enzyme related to lactoylglutathione lyase
MTTTTTTNAVTWFEVFATDPAHARDFYGSLFGWKFEDDNGYSLVNQGDGAAIGGGIAAVREGMRPMALFNVQVDDVAATCKRAAKLGATVVLEPQTMPTGLTLAYLADADGNTFGVWKPPGA